MIELDEIDGCNVFGSGAGMGVNFRLLIKEEVEDGWVFDNSNGCDCFSFGTYNGTSSFSSSSSSSSRGELGLGFTSTDFGGVPRFLSGLDFEVRS